MIAAVLFINQKGEVIMSRMYRDGFSRSVADTFRTQACRTHYLRWPAAPLVHILRFVLIDLSCALPCGPLEQERLRCVSWCACGLRQGIILHCDGCRSL